MKETKTLTVVFASDLCTSYIRGTMSETDFRALYRDVFPILSGADFSIVNLECPIRTGTDGEPIVKSGPNLWGTPSDLSAVTVPGFDCVTLANNHFGDFGAPGVLSTLRYLADAGVAYIGGGDNLAAAYRAYRLEGRGCRLSFLSVCENEFGCAGEGSPGSAGFNLARLSERIREERGDGRRVVVIFHGGNERDPLPSPDTVDRYRVIVNLGADAVIAMHTHCMQGYEYYRGAPIVYSMGNFFFPHAGKEGDPTDREALAWNRGYMVRMTVPSEGKIGIKPIPYVLEQDAPLLRVYRGEEREAMLAYLSRLSAPIVDRAELSRYFDAWCLGEGERYARSGLFYHPDAWESGSPSDEERRMLVRTRNLFSCEAHDSLLRNLLLTLLDPDRFQRAKETVPALEALKGPGF